MDTRTEIDAYLARIGIEGPPPPTIAGLATIVAAHVTAIPFENIAAFTGASVDLAPDVVMRKLVKSRRGGYCYEQNGLLMRSLTALGFAVQGLMARVLWGGPEDAVSPRSHMLLLVRANDGERLADVGFGGMTPTVPLRLEANIEQPTPLGTFRLIRDGDDWRMQIRVALDWRTLYRFDLTAAFEPDYEQANWHVSTHPSSIFVTGLSAARATAKARLALRNRTFSIYYADGRVERRELADADAVIETLDREFHINVPDPAALRERLKTLP